MASIPLLTLLTYLEVGLCLAALCAIVAKKQWMDYWSLGSFLAVRASSNSILLGLIYYNDHTLNKHHAYVLYFYVYWISFAVESVLALLIVYSVFRLAMAPHKGLQQLGMLVFRWAASISVVVALGSAYAPNMKSIDYFVAAVLQLQRTQSILTLCLLVFVCFAIRPMGLNYGSRVFGVSLGLGVMATNDLLQSALFTIHLGIQSNRNIINGIVICTILVLWTAYFALPEPKRRIIVLPTTSPFLRWNQISQVLGDSPGYVAVGGVPHELLAPAELEVMKRASRKMPIPFPESLSA